jgi:hypothetical protein
MFIANSRKNSALFLFPTRISPRALLEIVLI